MISMIRHSHHHGRTTSNHTSGMAPVQALDNLFEHEFNGASRLLVLHPNFIRFGRKEDGGFSSTLVVGMDDALKDVVRGCFLWAAVQCDLLRVALPDRRWLSCEEWTALEAMAAWLAANRRRLDLRSAVRTAAFTACGVDVIAAVCAKRYGSR